MTFVDELKAVRENVLARATKVLTVPGSRGTLAVRFKPPEDRDKLTQVVAAYMGVGALSREQELQLIVDCCDEVVRPTVGVEPKDWPAADADGGPLRFDGSDPRWDSDTARGAVEELYNLDLQPLADAGHADALVDWLQGLDAEADSRVEGKSENGADS
jgi:hypothetical protein